MSRSIIVGTRGPVECIITARALAKPSAQRHAKRLAQKQKARGRHEESARYADKHGKFTIPHNKE
jgi:hypothetical protein